MSTPTPEAKNEKKSAAGDNAKVTTITTTATTSTESEDGLPQLQGRLHRWAVDQHQFLAGFAATKYTKNGPGALFVFANCGLEDLLVADEDAEYDAAQKLERQIILVWGGVTAKATVTLEELRTKIVDKTSGLERSIEQGCDRESFPVVLCAGMEYATVRVFFFFFFLILFSPFHEK